MGVIARYPIALAPGMGLNAYFTYTVCIKMHVPWQTALGAVFLSGVIFLALTAAGIRQMILHAIPHQLYAAVASGIGLFIAFIGFQHAGPRRPRPQHAGWPGQYPQPHLVSLALRPHPHGRPRNPQGEGLHPYRRAHRHRPCLAAGAGALDARSPVGFGALAQTAFKLNIGAAHQQGSARNHLRLLLRRPLRQSGHAGGRHQARRAHRPRPFHSRGSTASSSPTPRHRLRLAGRNLDRHQLRGVDGRRGRGRPLRRNRHRHRPPVSAPSAPRPSSASCPRRPPRPRSSWWAR